MRSLFRGLKAVSVVTLILFSWTYLPLYQVAAYAAESRHESKNIKSAPKKQRPEERLEQLLDDLKERTGKAEKKAAKHEDTFSDIEEIKTRKTEIEALDADLRKDFAATEKKLKDANLPKEILDRHNAFVKNYEDNLAQLKANVNAVEKAKAPATLTAELAKTKKHLDKVKPPKKPKLLDPNKLPNRIVKAKERKPKLKKEEWEKELKKDPKKTRAAQRQQQKQIIVASNGPLTALLSGTDFFAASIQPDENWQLAGAPAEGVILSAATLTYPYPEEMYPLPWQTDMAPEDKQETPETHITEAIRAKATELDNNPIKMFNWLYNNIQLVPSYGSIQGADMCLQTKQCNETDIASLTIAMFRAADWPARYEFVTAQLDIDRFMENMGGFTDPMAAITFAATGGIPVRPVISGGKITAVQFERVYATALLPMGYYIGAVAKRGWSQPMWMPIDVSLKHYVTTPGMDLSTTVPFDAQSFINQIQSTATINEAEGYVTNVNSALIQQTMQDYQTRVQDYISQNTPTATVGDVLGKREIKQINYQILSPAGWTKPVTARVQSHTLPDSMKYKVSFIVQDVDTMETSFSHTINIAEVAGKRVTLSYVPATATDQQVINNYGGIFNAPAYLVNVKPQIKIEGVVVATGNPIGLGKDQAFNMQFVSAAYGSETVSNTVTAGAYYGIGINPSRVTQELLSQRKTKLGAVKDTCGNTPYADECGGELLFTTAIGYFYLLSGFEDATAQSNAIVKMRDVSEAIVSDRVDVSKLFGIPRSIVEAGMMIDVDRNIYVALSKNEDQGKIPKFMLAVGQMSSVLEHGVFEILHQAKGISTMQILQLANSQGIPVYSITPANMSSVLPKVDAPSEVMIDIQNALNAGKHVVIPQHSITYYTWTGTGYIIFDPATGAGAYMISTNLAGGGCCIAAGGAANHCLLVLYEIWHFLDTLAAIILPINVGIIAAVGVFTEIGFAGIALALGLSMLAILIGVLIAITVIYIIKTIIQNNTVSNAGYRNLYLAERGKHGYRGC